MSFGERLKAIRKTFHMNQLELAAKLHVSGAHISKLEADKANPSDMLINSICLIWHIDENWLRTGEGSMESKVDRIYEFVKENPELRQHYMRTTSHDQQLEQLR